MEGLRFCFKEIKAFVSVLCASKVFVFFFLFGGVFVYSHWTASRFLKNQQMIRSSNLTFEKIIPSLTCPTQLDNLNITCTANLSTLSSSRPPLHSLPHTHPNLPAHTCPDYFRWIHEDLRPWAKTGITKEKLESSTIHAAFRLVIIDGRAYVHHYHSVYQTRDSFTIWGIVQLLRRYPGRVPDLDLMFNCEDLPVVPRAVASDSPPPPLFRYCKDDSTVDIVFPDWSFWGWPELNIRSWAMLREELIEASEATGWKEREPYAHWKGNPNVAKIREDLMKCNAKTFEVNWELERWKGFPSSDLASQCTHRYKIYVEGVAWSVSQKYILGCDSTTLYVDSSFQDFVSRGLRPGRHYWPIPKNGMCWAIEQAVDWGNKHEEQVEAIGKAGSRIMKEEMKMDYVYDYMLHLLTEYSKLLTYKPTKPEEAIELCLESVACPLQGKARDFLLEAMEKEHRSSEPCSLPPPFSAEELSELLNEKANGTKRVVESLMMSRGLGRRVGFVEFWSFLWVIIGFICFV